MQETGTGERGEVQSGLRGLGCGKTDRVVVLCKSCPVQLSTYDKNFKMALGIQLPLTTE